MREYFTIALNEAFPEVLMPRLVKVRQKRKREKKDPDGRLSWGGLWTREGLNACSCGIQETWMALAWDRRIREDAKVL